MDRAGVPCRPPALALVHVPGGCGGQLEGPGPGPPYGGVPLRVQGAARRRLGRAFTALGGGGGALSLVPCSVRVAARVRQGGLVRPSLRRARPGLSGVLGHQARPWGVAAGGLVPAVVSVRVPCTAGGLLASPPPRALARGLPGEGGAVPVGGSRPPTGARLTGRRAVVLAFANGPPAAASCGAVGGGVGPTFAGAAGGGPGQPSVVSGQQVRGTLLPRASAFPAPSAYAHQSASLPACPWPSRSSGWRVTLVLLMSCCADGGGGGGAQGRGTGPARRAPGAVGPLRHPRARCLGSEARPAGFRAMAARFGRDLPHPLAWGQRRRRVPRAVAPVAKGGAQGPG